MSERPLFISQVLPQTDREDEEIIRKCGDISNIHRPGSIQPHGVYMGVSEPDLKVTHISENTLKVFGIAYQEILDKTLDSIISPDDLNVLKSNLGSKNFDMVNPLRLTVSNKPFDIILHRTDNTLVLELEPVINESESNIDTYRNLSQEAITKIMSAQTTKELCQVAVDQIRNVSGYDRITLYRYDEQWNGQVIAESLTPGTTSFLGQRFPAWETPAKTRELYAKNPCRYIPHVFHVPTKVVSNNPTPIDMTFAQLRSCPDCHLQYMNNMGVSSTMSFPVVINGKLWALFTCHSLRPREVSFTHRTICSQVAKVFPELLQAKEQPQAYQSKLNGIRDKVLANIESSGNVPQGIIANQQELLDMASADGIAVFANGSITTAGNTPEVSDIQQMVNTLCDQYNGVVFKDDSAGLIYTSNFGQYLKRYASSLNGVAEKITDASSGVLIVPINGSRSDYMILFRGEQPTECVWGGNPDRATLFPDKYNPTALTPRNAFDAWKQLVRGTSIPWLPYEVDAVKGLRDKLMQIN